MFRKTARVIFTVLFALGINKFSFAMMCAEHVLHHKKTAQAESAEYKHAEGVNVGNKICPVSGDKIDENTKATYEYEGKIYNLCCAMCIDEFKKDPQKYIKKIEEELQVQSKEEKHGMEMMRGHGMHEGHHH
jgi:YHS domain-containing protein